MLAHQLQLHSTCMCKIHKICMQLCVSTRHYQTNTQYQACTKGTAAITLPRPSQSQQYTMITCWLPGATAGTETCVHINVNHSWGSWPGRHCQHMQAWYVLQLYKAILDGTGILHCWAARGPPRSLLPHLFSRAVHTCIC
jgi:hypothetical protein